MNVAKASLFALCIAIVCVAAPGGAPAQSDTRDKPVDLKPLIPPLVPPVLPPNSLLTPGTVGGANTPYSSAPMADQTLPQPAPGIRLSIPTR